MRKPFVKALLFASLLVLLFQLACGKKAALERPKKRPRLPEGLTLDDVRQRRGMTRQGKEKLDRTMCRLTRLLEKYFDRKEDKKCTQDGDIAYTNEQANYMVQKVEKMLKSKEEDKENKKTRKKSKRVKRQAVDKNLYPKSIWPEGPIPFAFDYDADDFTSDVEPLVRSAIDHWEALTCLRFEDDVPSDENTTFIYFTVKDDTGCFANIGRVEGQQQIISLAHNCLSFGTIVHEIGHTIGLVHQQSRTDRDDHILVNLDNIHSWGLNQYMIWFGTVNEGVQYDFASVMHYPAKSWANAKNPDIPILVPLPPYNLSRRSMGTRSGLTFWDRKIANLLYCEDSCSALQCERGGYPNPNDCDTCICPPGFAGTLCGELDTISGDNFCLPKNSEVIQVENVVDEYLQTVNYHLHPSNYTYEGNARCNFHLKADPGCKIRLSFHQDINLECEHDDICTHFVAIDTDPNSGKPPPRFCCTGEQMPGQGYIVSEGTEVMVTFDSTTPPRHGEQDSYHGGFQLKYRLDDPSCLSK